MTRTDKALTVLITSALGVAMFATLCAAVRALRPILLHGLPVALLVLVATVPASAQDRRTPIAIGAYMTAGFWDAAGTAYCHGKGTCREVNPLLAPLVDRRGVVPAMTVKGAMHVGISAWLLHDRHKHPKRAFWTAVGLTAAQVAVNIGNARRLTRGE